MRLITVLAPCRLHQPQINVCAIACDCGVHFAWPSSVSLAECPNCGRQELWHGVDPKPDTGPWSEPEMDQPHGSLYTAAELAALEEQALA